jgi:beta-lactamase superfamily II metal-dependent hydrolase
VPASGVRVRAYNVRFGDCVLVSFDSGAGEKHILIDFGNAPAQVRGDGGRNDVFAPVAKDLERRTDKRIDLLVMSHEHLDHLEGFYSERGVFDRFTFGEIWMSAMSAPDYYTRFPQCKPELRARFALLAAAERWSREGRFQRLPEPVRALMANNVLALSNKDRIDSLRGRVPKKNVRYLSRRTRAVGCKALGSQVKLEVLAPERDASVYYKSRGNHFWQGTAARLGAGDARVGPKPASRSPRAPSQIADDEFEALRDDIAELDMLDLLAIDKAANNTSLVLRITVGGKVLLFPGDAEGESWALMKQKKLLKPVDLLKLAHHGSMNGMPFDGQASVLADVLKPRKGTTALVSTCRGVYGDTRETEIPHHALMDRLAQSCKKVWVTQDAAGFGEGFEITV